MWFKNLDAKRVAGVLFTGTLIVLCLSVFFRPREGGDGIDVQPVVQVSESGAEAAEDSLAFGLALYSKGNYEAAIEVYTRILENAPDDLECRFHRGFTLSIVGRYQDAIGEFDRLLSANDSDARAHCYRGYANQMLGKSEEAFADYARAVELDSEFAPARRGLSWIYGTAPIDELRNGKLAIEHGTKACELVEWNDYVSLFILAAAYAEAGDFERAVSLQEESLALAPSHEVEHLTARLAIFRSGKPFREVIQ